MTTTTTKLYTDEIDAIFSAEPGFPMAPGITDDEAATTIQRIYRARKHERELEMNEAAAKIARDHKAPTSIHEAFELYSREQVLEAHRFCAFIDAAVAHRSLAEGPGTLDAEVDLTGLNIPPGLFRWVADTQWQKKYNPRKWQVHMMVSVKNPGDGVQKDLCFLELK